MLFYILVASAIAVPATTIVTRQKGPEGRGDIRAGILSFIFAVPFCTLVLILALQLAPPTTQNTHSETHPLRAFSKEYGEPVAGKFLISGFENGKPILHYMAQHDGHLKPEQALAEHTSIFEGSESPLVTVTTTTSSNWHIAPWSYQEDKTWDLHIPSDSALEGNHQTRILQGQ